MLQHEWIDAMYITMQNYITVLMIGIIRYATMILYLNKLVQIRMHARRWEGYAKMLQRPAIKGGLKTCALYRMIFVALMTVSMHLLLNKYGILL